MANVRCPMCSKVNPPEAVVCAYCGARLKPVRPASTPAASASQGEAPDWLRGLRGSEPEKPQGEESSQPSSAVPSGTSKTPARPASGGSDVPDWLSRIRDKAHEEVGGSEEPTGEDQGSS